MVSQGRKRSPSVLDVVGAVSSGVVCGLTTRSAGRIVKPGAAAGRDLDPARFAEPGPRTAPEAADRLQPPPRPDTADDRRRASVVRRDGRPAVVVSWRCPPGTGLCSQC